MTEHDTIPSSVTVTTSSTVDSMFVWYLPADEGGIGYSSQYSCPRALLEGMSTD
jgi:hypothetical protein